MATAILSETHNRRHRQGEQVESWVASTCSNSNSLASRRQKWLLKLTPFYNVCLGRVLINAARQCPHLRAGQADMPGQAE
jgi:hypothetical protein